MERFVLRAGHTAERVHYDYGYDLILSTYNANGEVESEYTSIQLKATDAPRFVENRSEIALTVERRDWDFWREQGPPVLLILFDAENEVAYWVHVQAVLLAASQSAAQTITVRFDRQQIVSEEAVAEWRRIKNNYWEKTND